MIGLHKTNISDTVTLHHLVDPTFKTIRISVNMLVPMTHQTAAEYSILPALVSRATREYPDYTAFGQKLASLYGAYLDSSVSKLGPYQVLSLTVGGIASRYAFDGENMAKELSNILTSIFSQPLVDDDGLFFEDGFIQEQRQILEIFDAEFSDKMQYARFRGQQILFGDSPEGIYRYGSRESVAALTREQVSQAWSSLLAQSRFEIFILGDCEADLSSFLSVFSELGRVTQLPAFSSRSTEVKSVVEEQELAQSKLFIGFTLNAHEESIQAFRLMSAVLGGTPSAKLFVHVREEQGLCYYCSSRFDANNRTLSIESGVERDKIEETKMAIMTQIADMQAGKITDAEILSAKLALCNSYRSTSDSLRFIESWYLSQLLFHETLSPDQAVKAIMDIQKTSLVQAAKALNLDTIFTLYGTR